MSHGASPLPQLWLLCWIFFFYFNHLTSVFFNSSWDKFTSSFISTCSMQFRWFPVLGIADHISDLLIDSRVASDKQKTKQRLNQWNRLLMLGLLLWLHRNTFWRCSERVLPESLIPQTPVRFVHLQPARWAKLVGTLNLSASNDPTHLSAGTITEQLWTNQMQTVS